MEHFIKEYEERYFIGIEHVNGVTHGNFSGYGKLWSVFLEEDIKLLNKDKILNKFIGLECYPPDFMDTKTFDYFALAETKELFFQPGFTSKKLPKGTYILYPINFDDIVNEIKKVYQDIRARKENIHMGFDYEDYLIDQDYTKEGAKLNFALLLNND